MATRSGDKYSEVWNDIADGFINSANSPGLEIRVTGPESYHDNREYINLVAEAVVRNPEVIVLPFSPSGEMSNKFMNVLDSYNGDIVAVNVPPSPKQKEFLGDRLIGYVGMNEFAAGEIAAKELILRKYDEEIYSLLVLVHEQNHRGLEMRIQGVKEGVLNYGIGIDVYSVYVDAEKQTLVVPDECDTNFGIVTLGIRGTEAALTSFAIKPLGIVGIDLNNSVKQSILNGKIACTLIQHPYEEGMRALEMAINPGKKFTEVFCGPTIVDINNVHAFI